MNFLLRSASTAAAEHIPTATPRLAASSVPPPSSNASKPPVTTREGLIVEDKVFNMIEEKTSDVSGFGGENEGMVAAMSAKDHIPQTTDKHIDVKADEGWIIIPYKELSDNWKDASDIQWFHNLDRSFIFPGEQVHLLACLSASKKDTEVITPFKVAAVMNKKGSGNSADNHYKDIVDKDKLVSEAAQVNLDDHTDPINGDSHKDHYDCQTDVSSSDSLLRIEDRRRQTQTLLQRFNDSHFFVRITESGEPLWSSRCSPDTSETGDADGSGNEKAERSAVSINTVIDQGRFDARVSGGLARSSIKCCFLSNGDIVILLQVNVDIDVLKDPMLEILQFETYDGRVSSSQNVSTSTNKEHDSNKQESNADCVAFEELLKWLLPLDNSLPPLTHPFSPPLASASHKASFSASSSSQLFSFNHFRSYSMSSINSGPPSTTTGLPQSVSSTSFDLEHWDQFASQKLVQSQKMGSKELLSFRGVALEPDRFSVCCGLEGIYVPGRRWQRKLEMIRPIDIHTFISDCNTDDLLCVQIKNVSPAHIPDVVVYIDAISLIFEEASKGGPSLSVPIVCIEAGMGYSLPNLALRSGEEHSFILKPATSLLKSSNVHSSRTPQQSRLKGGNKQSSRQFQRKAMDGEQNVSSYDKYAILVSCRCNYTESRLFFKNPTNWRPRISRDLMISVGSEMSRQTLEDDGRALQLPVQVLTLQASNLTSEDLTLTILAPASFTAHPSVVLFNSSPSTPLSPLVGFSTTQRLSSMPLLVENQKQRENIGVEQHAQISDIIPTTALACNHLWLQSRVPLGCIPSLSTATIKLGLLPLTDGIITLDTLQINVEGKGTTYVPEQSLKINATRSIATAIV